MHTELLKNKIWCVAQQNEFENVGYKTEPLYKRKLQAKAYEAGYGYRVRFGIWSFLYHHKEKNHREDEYYKIVCGNKGVYRYDREGK